MLSVSNIYLQSSISAQKVSTVFTALLRQVPKECKEAVLPEALLKNHQVICLLYEENRRKLYNDNLCLFGYLALRFHGKGGIEEKNSEMFNPCQEKTGAVNPPSFYRVCMNYNPSASDLVQMNIFLYDIDIAACGSIGELAVKVLRHLVTLFDIYVIAATLVMSPISRLLSQSIIAL